MMYELGNHQKNDILLQTLKSLVQRRSILAVTGAGISVPSGLPTISGTIQGVSIARLFEKGIWIKNPQQAYRAYREMFTEWRKAKPNAAHTSLACHGIPVITQNIDGLHIDAGSVDVIELHGNLRELRCYTCAGVFSGEASLKASVPRCPTCGSQLFPGFSFEGEEVRHIARTFEWAGMAEVLLIVGTELSMYPIRQLREMALSRSLSVIWITAAADYWVPLLFDVTD